MILQQEADRLKASNMIDLDNFAMRFIKEDAKYKAELKAKEIAADVSIKDETQSVTDVPPMDLDESMKRDMAKIWELLETLNCKGESMVQLGNIVESRREDLKEFKGQLEEVKKQFPFLELNSRTLKKQRSFVNWNIDGNTGDITIDGQLLRNTWITACFLDGRIKYGNICMKILAILMLGNDKDYSEGFNHFIQACYKGYLKSPTTFSLAKVSTILPAIKSIMYEEEAFVGLKLIKWLLSDTKIGSFLPFNKIDQYVTSMIDSRLKVDLDELLYFIVEESFESFSKQFIELCQNYRVLLRRMIEEIAFKNKPRMVRGVKPQTITQKMDLLDIHKRLTQVFNTKDHSVMSTTEFASSVHIEGGAHRPLRSPLLQASKSSKMLFKITNGAGTTVRKNEQSKASRSRELSTSATVKTDYQDKNEVLPADISSRGLLVLLSQYHQSIRGCRLGLTK